MKKLTAGTVEEIERELQRLYREKFEGLLDES